MKKNIGILVITLLIITITGCFNQKNEKKSIEYSIIKGMNTTTLVAEKDLDGIEMVLNGKVEEKDILITENLLRIVKNNENRTVLSIAGYIRKGSNVVELKGTVEISSIKIVVASKEERTTKRAGEILLGDFDLSGTVDLKDFVVFAQAYGTSKSQYDIAPATIGTGVWSNIYCISKPDGAVNLEDFIVFAKNYGKKSSAVYHVSKVGNDSNPGTETQPFLTINRFISIAKAGDTCQIHSGTYVETTEKNPFVPESCWFDGVRVSIGMQSSGTIDKPITLMAAPGDEGKVIINSESKRLGFFTNGFDYWHLYGLRIENSLEFGIGSPSKANLELPDDSDLAIGWRIENCLIKGVTPTNQGNTAGIGMWASKNWVITNNRITQIANLGTRVSSGIQAYGTIDSLVEHNYIEAAAGIFLKDHFLKTVNPRTTNFEYEIRYNTLNVADVGFTSTIKGFPNVESGSNYVHHNIMYGFSQGESSNVGLSGSETEPGGSYRFENNIVDATGTSGNALFNISDHKDFQSRGNILIGGSLIYNIVPGAGFGALTYSDYNLFSYLNIALDRMYGGVAGTKSYSDLISWQAAKIGEAKTLRCNNPDTHSKIVNADDLFVNRAGRDYHYKQGSPAIGMMPDGSNAGCYQTGKENIGLLPSYSAGI